MTSVHLLKWSIDLDSIKPLKPGKNPSLPTVRSSFNRYWTPHRCLLRAYDRAITKSHSFQMIPFLYFISLGFAVFLFVRSRKRSSLPLPPGPKKLPIIGNVLELPTSFEWETYARWGKKYSTCATMSTITRAHYFTS